MVAIVAGNGLGLFDSSLNTIGGQGVSGRSNQAELGAGTSTSRLYVNTASGNLIVQALDEQVSGMGVDAQFLRTYNSRGLLDDRNGDNWRHSGERNLIISGTLNTSGSSIIRIGSDGSQTVYDFDDLSNTYQSTDGGAAHDIIRLTTRDETQVLQWREGSSHLSEFYDQTSGRLLAQVDSNDNAITYSYDTSDRLSTIVDSESGQTIRLEYNTSGQLEAVSTRSSASDAFLRQVHYLYDSNDRLVSVAVDLSNSDGSVVDFNSIRTLYTYEGTSRLVTTIQRIENNGPVMNVAAIQYDDQDRVTQVTDMGGVTTFDYSTTDITVVTNGEGNVWTYENDSEGRLERVESELVNGVRESTAYQYNDNGDVSEIITGTSIVRYFHDANGNRLREADSEGRYVNRVFSSDNLLLSETVYTNASMQALPSIQTATDTGLAALPNDLGESLTTTYVYSETRELRFVISPESRVTEYQYNDYGLRTRTIQYNDLFDLSIPPYVAEPLNNQNIAVNGNFNFTVPASTFIDLAGGALTLSARMGDGTNLPAWLNFDDASGTFTGTPSAEGDYSVLVTATNSASTSASAVFRLRVGDGNQAPVANNGELTTATDTPRVITVAELLSNVTDEDSPSPVLISVNNAVNGSVIFDSAVGTVTFNPNSGYSGTASFDYSVSDGEGGSALATISVDVSLPNSAPIAVNYETTGTEGTPLVLSFIEILNAGSSDPDGDTLTIAAVRATDGSGDSVQVNSGAETITFTPAAGFSGETQFAFDVIDGNGGSATASVIVTVSALGNNAPVLTADTFGTDPDTVLVMSVAELLRDDSDIDGDLLTLDQVMDEENPNGSTVLDMGAGTVTFTPNAGFNGMAEFSYRVSDGRGASTWTSVLIDVSPNVEPSAGRDSVTTPQDSILIIPWSDLLVNDIDANGDPLTIDIAFDAGNGFVSVDSSARTVRYTPRAGYFGPDTFIYQISDGRGGLNWPTVDVLVTSTGPNIDPTVVNDILQTEIDTPIVVTFEELLENDWDLNGDTLTVDFAFDPLYGTLTQNSTSVTFTPTPGIANVGGFMYQASDGNGGVEWATATIAITTGGPNIDPIARDDIMSTPENTPLVVPFERLLANDDDPNFQIVNFDFAFDPINGYLSTDHEAGTVTFTPDENTSGAAQFTYQISDGNGGVEWAVANIVVYAGPNVAPTANPDFFTTDRNTAITIDFTELSANDTDDNGQPIKVDIAFDPLNGSITQTATSVTFTPDPSSTEDGQFQYQLSDDGGELNWGVATITVTSVVTPITLDLNGDGLSFSPLVHFDIDSDGFLENTAWVGVGDGLLALDRNNDGAITSGNEISFINDFAGATTDLEGLVGFDSNANGLLEAGDTLFANFLVWQDANQDGISTAEELSSLADLGITEIRLTPSALGISPLARVDLTNTATFVQYGQEHILGDVGFQYSELAESVSSSTGNSVTGLESLLTTWAGSAERDLESTQVSETAYDAFGNLQRQTAYGTVNPDGSGFLDASTTITDFVYSANGQLLDTIAVRGDRSGSANTTINHFTYDDAGRLLTSTGANGTSTNSYDGLNHQITTTNSAGLITTQAFDVNGKLMSVQQAGVAQTRMTQFYYDGAGRLGMAEDAEGARSWVFYDQAGRIAFNVDAAGAVSGFDYNALGLVETETRYATTITDTSSWFSGSTDWLAGLSVTKDELVVGTDITIDSSNDRQTRYAYGNTGLLTSTTEERGLTGSDRVITTEYDGAGRVSETSINALRTTQFYYNDDGQVIGLLNAQGYLSENTYDDLGRLIQTTRYDAVVYEANSATFDSAKAASISGEALSTWHYYDAQGRKIAVVSEDGFLTDINFDVAGLKTTTRQYAQHISVSSRDTFIDVQSRSGIVFRASETTVDGFGRIIEVLAHDGTKSVNQYDAVTGRLTRVVISDGRVAEGEDDDFRAVRTRYNAFGEISGLVSGVGEETVADLNNAIDQYGQAYLYNAIGQRISETGPQGQRSLFFYDDANRLTATVNAEGDVASSSYNAFGNITETRQYYRNITNVSALLGGDVSSISAWMDSYASDTRNIQSTQSYTSLGQLNQSIDGEGNTTNYLYNDVGNLSQIITPTASPNGSSGAPDYSTTLFYYDRLGQVTDHFRNSGDSSNHTWEETEYDGFGRVIRSKDANGNNTQRNYNQTSNGLEIVVTDALGQTRTTHFDAYGRIDETLDNEGRVTDFTYSDANRSTTITTAEGRTSVSGFNVHGEVIESYDGKDNLTQFIYTTDGNLETVTNRLDDLVTNNTYDNSGRLISTIDGEGNEITFGYDDANRMEVRTGDSVVTRNYFNGLGLKYMVSHGNARTHFEYDQNGRVTQEMVEPDQYGAWETTQYTYTYTDNGLVARIDRGEELEPIQESIEYEYDGLGRQIAQITDPGGEHLIQRSRYDLNGNLTRVSVENGSKDLESWVIYNAINQKELEINSAGEVTRFSYDSRGLVTETRVYVSALSTSELSTLRGQDVPDSINIPAESAADRRSKFVYDNDSRLRFSLSLLNGVNDWRITENVYDANSNVIETRAFDAEVPNPSTISEDHVVTTLQALGYRFQSWGNTTDVDLKTRRTAFVFDAENQLRYSINGENGVTENIYDQAGNIVTTKAYKTALPTFPASGTELTESGVVALIGTSPDSRDTHYAYDSHNRQSFVVDALNNVSRTEYSTRGQIDATTRYAATLSGVSVYSHENILAAVDSANSLNRTTEFVYDTHGRQIFSVDDSGFVSRTVYNDVGRVQHVIEYAVPYTSHISLLDRPQSGYFGSINSLDDDDRAITYIYDGAGRQRYSIDALNFVTEMEYDGLGNVTKETHYDDAVDMSGLGYNDFTEGEVSALITATPIEDRVTNYFYDNLGRRTITAAGGEALSKTTYNTFGQVAERTAYDVNFSLNATESQLNSLISGKNLRDTPAPGETYVRGESYIYDNAGRLRSTTDALGYTEFYAFDTLGNRTSMTNKNGEIMTYEYDDLGRVTHEISPQVDVVLSSGGSSVRRYVVSRTIYDALGRVKSRTDGLLRTSLHGADIISNERSTHFVYDSVSRVKYTLDAQNHIVENDYNNFGQVTKMMRYAVEDLTVNAFDEASIAGLFSGPDSHVDAVNDRSTEYVYNNLGQRVYTIESEQTLTKTEYNAFGEVEASLQFTVAAPSDRSIAGLDAFTVGYSLGDANETRGETYTYNVLGQLTQTDDALGNFETYGYDSFGNRTSFINKKNDEWTYEFDGLNRLTREVTPQVLVVIDTDGDGINYAAPALYATANEFEYDAFGNVEARVDGVIVIGGGEIRSEALRTEYGYDALNRQTRISDPGIYNDGRFYGEGWSSGFKRVTEVRFDAVGNAVANFVLVSVDGGVNEYVTIFKVYDELNRIVFDIDPLQYVTGYEYNAMSDVVSLTRYATALGDGLFDTSSLDTRISLANIEGTNGLSTHANDRQITTEYDTLGRNVSVVQHLGASANNPETRYEYTAFGEVKLQSVRVGLTPNVTWNDTHHYYDTLGRETVVVDALGFGNLMAYDRLGNITRTTEYANLTTEVAAGSGSLADDRNVVNSNDDRILTYTYDALNRQTQVRRQNFTYHEWNVTDFTPVPYDRSSSDTAGRLISSTGYDDLGNMTSSTDVNNKVTSYIFNKLGNLTQVTQPERMAAIAENATPETLAINPFASGSEVSTTPVTKFELNVHGNIITEIHYAYNPDLTTPPNVRGEDRTITHGYDFIGNEIYTVDAVSNAAPSYPLNSVLQREYDIAGRIRAEVQTVSAEVWEPDLKRKDYDVIAASVLSTSPSAGTGEFEFAARSNTFTYYYDESVIESVEFVEYGDTLGYESPVTPLLAKLRVNVVYHELAETTPLYTNQELRREYYYDAAGNQQKTLNTYTDADDNLRRSGDSVVYNSFGEVKEKYHVSGTGYGDYNTAGSFDTPQLLTTYIYDNAGRLDQTIAADGITTYLYDLAGNATDMIKGDGGSRTRTTTWLRDQNGNVKEEYLPSFNGYEKDTNPNTTLAQDYGAVGVDGSETISPILLRDYDRWGNVTRLTDIMGTETYYTFDHNNQLVTETTDIEVVDLVASSDTNPEMDTFTKTHRFYYDLMGRVIGERDTVDGQSERLRRRTYNSIGQLRTQVDGTELEHHYRYDGYGQQIAVRDGDGTIRLSEYDDNGRLTGQFILRQTNGDSYSHGVSGQTGPERVHLQEFMYDTAGRRYAEIGYLNQVGENEDVGAYKKTVYDARGLITRTINPEDVTLDYVYNSMGLKTRETNGMGLVKNWDYHSGNQSALTETYTDHDNNVTTYVYTGFGELFTETAVVDGVAKVREYDYHDNGLLKSVEEDYTAVTLMGSVWAYGVGRATNPQSPSALYSTQIVNNISEFDYDARGLKVKERVYIDDRTTFEGYFDLTVGHSEVTTTWISFAVGDKQVDENLTRYMVYSDYDNQGQLSRVESPRQLDDGGNLIEDDAHLNYLRYGYDALGNRAYVGSDSLNPGQSESASSEVLNAWYTYDDEGRVLIENGQLNTASAIEVGTKDGSIEYMYNNDGLVYINKTYSHTAPGTVGGEFGGQVFILPGGDNVGILGTGGPGIDEVVVRIEGTNYTITYDAASVGGYISSMSYLPVGSPSPGYEVTYHLISQPTRVMYEYGYSTYNDINQKTNFKTRTTFDGDTVIDGIERWNAEYNDLGFQIFKTIYADYSESVEFRSISSEYGKDGRILTQTGRNLGGDEREVSKYDFDDSYDNAGNIGHYETEIYEYSGDFKGTQVYRNLYAVEGGQYQIKTKSVTPVGLSDYRKANSKYSYDAWGQLSSITTGNYPYHREVSFFAYDLSGRILSNGDSNFYYQAGNVLGSIGEDGADFLPVVQRESAAVPGSYTVRGGETLRAIAQNVFGDSSLWYLIAETNGLSLGPNDLLSKEDYAGRNLEIPNTDVSLRNNATTFKPYNPGEIIGDTTPALMYVPPPPKACSSLVFLIIIVIVIIVTVFTAGAAASSAPAVAGGATGATGATVGTTATVGTLGASGASTWSLGVTALSGGGVVAGTGVTMGAGTAIGSAFIGGFVGNVAGQVLNKATGQTDQGFSLREAFAAGLTSGITAGAGAYITGSSPAAIAARGAVGAAGSVAARKAAGLEASFSWRSVAIQAVTAVIATKVGSATGISAMVQSSNPFAQVLGGTLQGFLNGAISAKLNQQFNDGGKVNYRLIAFDAFGNALGNSIVSGLEGNWDLDFGSDESEGNGSESDVEKVIRELERKASESRAREAEEKVKESISKNPPVKQDVVVTPKMESSYDARLGLLGAYEDGALTVPRRAQNLVDEVLTKRAEFDRDWDAYYAGNERRAQAEFGTVSGARGRGFDYGELSAFDDYVASRQSDNDTSRALNLGDDGGGFVDILQTEFGAFGQVLSNTAELIGDVAYMISPSRLMVNAMGGAPEGSQTTGQFFASKVDDVVTTVSFGDPDVQNGLHNPEIGRGTEKALLLTGSGVSRLADDVVKLGVKGVKLGVGKVDDGLRFLDDFIGGLRRGDVPNSIDQRLARISTRTPEEIADRSRVAGLIRKARAQQDPGVPRLVSDLESNGVRLKDVNHITGNPAREVDIETAAGTIVQVKKLSSANALIKQIHNTEKATGQRTVGFVIEQHKKANKVVNQASRHVEATNSLDKLIEMLK